MARPLRLEYPGAFYHVTSRGNEQKEIFKSQRDREKFLSYLESAGERYGAVIHAYCLMSNHYHLLLETPSGNLSQIMRHLNGAYTTYFNIKRKRAGHLFQGRFKAILVDADTYALELSRYIHLNPVRAGIVTHPEDFAWSSHRYFIGNNEAPSWLKTDFILRQFGPTAADARKKYEAFVTDPIALEGGSPLERTVASAILGSDDFLAAIREKYLPEKQGVRNVPAVKELIGRPSPERIISGVRSVGGGDEAEAKRMSIYLCHRYSGAKLKEIGERFGMKESAVAQASRRFAARIREDTELRVVVEKMIARFRSEGGVT